MLRIETNGLRDKGSRHIKRWTGALAACALGAVAWRFAWATPPKDLTPTFLTGPTAITLDEVHIVRAALIYNFGNLW